MQQMTDEQRMRCLMAYPNAPILCNGNKYKLRSVNLYAKCLELDLEMTTNIVRANTCQLFLRSVSSLTDEECIEVARIARRNYHTAQQGRNIVDDLYSRVAPMYIREVTDYLCFISVHFGTVHGFDLVAEGIAILEDKIV